MTNNLIFSKKISTRSIIGAGLVVATLAAVVFPSVTNAETLYRQLQVGMSGSDVSSVQTFLARDVTLYPQGLVTGYFGFLTKAAVSRFQTRNGISPVGRIGPATLPVLNFQMSAAGGVSNSTPAPTIGNVAINVSRNVAVINWNTDELARGVVYYSTSPLGIYERTNSVDVTGNSVMSDASFRNSQSVSTQALQPNTTYYYLIYTTDQDGNVSVTWPSTFKTSN